MKNRKVLREMPDTPERMSTVVPFVLASSFARVIFVNRRRQLPEGFAGRSREFPPDSRLDFHARGCRAPVEARLDSGMMGADIWCRAVSFHREGRNTEGVRGGRGIYELNELHESYKVARERRRINAGQTSVTVYAYGREGWALVRSYHEGNRGV